MLVCKCKESTVWARQNMSNSKFHPLTLVVKGIN